MKWTRKPNSRTKAIGYKNSRKDNEPKRYLEKKIKQNNEIMKRLGMQHHEPSKRNTKIKSVCDKCIRINCPIRSPKMYHCDLRKTK